MLILISMYSPLIYNTSINSWEFWTCNIHKDKGSSSSFLTTREGGFRAKSEKIRVENKIALEVERESAYKKSETKKRFCAFRSH